MQFKISSKVVRRPFDHPSKGTFLSHEDIVFVSKIEVDSQPLVRGQLYKGQLFGNLNGGRLGIQPTP
jgi:hypothetical protein